MNFKNEIVINKPIDKVISLLEDPSNFPKWLPGFISMEPISGAPGQEGSKTRWKLKSLGIKTELIETITKRNLPDELHYLYTGKGMVNIQQNNFTVSGISGTKWTVSNQYRFNAVMTLFAWMMTGIFKKQIQKTLEQFKKFAENE